MAIKKGDKVRLTETYKTVPIDTEATVISTGDFDGELWGKLDLGKNAGGQKMTALVPESYLTIIGSTKEPNEFGYPFDVSDKVVIVGLEDVFGKGQSPYHGKIGTVDHIQNDDIDVVLDYNAAMIGFLPANVMKADSETQRLVEIWEAAKKMGSKVKLKEFLLMSDAERDELAKSLLPESLGGTKVSRNKYNYMYDRLLKIAPNIVTLLEEAPYPTDVYGKSQYRTSDFGGDDAYMALSIEGLEKDDEGRFIISMSHYYLQNGDMMCDPCMTVRLDPENKTLEAMSYKQDGGVGRGITKDVYGLTKDGKLGVNMREKKSQNQQLNMWTNNLVKQGHIVEFDPIEEEEEVVEETKPDYSFTYRMLSRLKQDNEYFLGHGGRYDGHLWAKNVPDQIAEMKKLWNKLPEDAKPEWLSWQDILDYEQKMSKEQAEEVSMSNPIDLDGLLFDDAEVTFNPMNRYGKAIKRAFEWMGVDIHPHHRFKGSAWFEYKGYVFMFFDNGGEFKLDALYGQDAENIKAGKDETNRFFNYLGAFYFTREGFGVGAKLLVVDMLEACDEYVAEQSSEVQQPVLNEYENRQQELAKLKDKHPIVVEWTEAFGDMVNQPFETIKELQDQIKKGGFTDRPEDTYLKWKVHFKGYPNPIRIDVSKSDGDYNFEKESLIDYLEREYISFDWSEFKDDPRTDGRRTIDYTQFLGKGFIPALSVKAFDRDKGNIWFIQLKPSNYFNPLDRGQDEKRRKYKKAIELGYKVKDFKAGKYGTAYILTKGDQALTNYGFNNIDSESTIDTVLDEMDQMGMLDDIKSMSKEEHEMVEAFAKPIASAIEKAESFSLDPNDYKNQYELNKAIEAFLGSKTDDYIYGEVEKEFIYNYAGYGGLEKYGARGKGLLWEYYTPKLLVEKMWGLAYKYGFSSGKVLEPSVGVGRFLDYTSNNDQVVAYEISEISAKICKIMHPKTDVRVSSFSQHFYNRNTYNPKFEKGFDLVIGNPPYGKMTDLRTNAESKRLGGSIAQFEHYFILRGLDCLKSGGLLVYVSTANLFTKGYESIKQRIAEKADLVDGYLLPNKTFKTTEIGTSIIVLRRK